MSKKYRVVINRAITVHKLGFCHICDLQWDLFTNPKEGIKAIRKHAMDTGHRVDIESGTTSECAREEIQS